MRTGDAAGWCYRAACAAALFLQFLSAPVAAEERRTAYGPGEILGFARHLASNGEYFRAYTELSRLKSYYPGISTRRYCISANSTFSMGEAAMTNILALSPPSGGAGSCAGAVFAADSAIALGHYPRALELSRAEPTAECDPFLGAALCRRAFISLVLLGRIDEAAGSECPYQNKTREGFDPDAYTGLLSYARGAFADRRSPAAALALGTVPGLGYAYAGNRPNGVIAFIVVSVFSALTYFSFRTDNAPLGVVFRRGGNSILRRRHVGGYREALRYNRSIGERVRETVMDELRPASDRDEIFQRYGIGHGKR
jgi:hypothetical protein